MTYKVSGLILLKLMGCRLRGNQSVVERSTSKPNANLTDTLEEKSGEAYCEEALPISSYILYVMWRHIRGQLGSMVHEGL